MAYVWHKLSNSPRLPSLSPSPIWYSCHEIFEIYDICGENVVYFGTIDQCRIKKRGILPKMHSERGSGVSTWTKIFLGSIPDYYHERLKISWCDVTGWRARNYHLFDVMRNAKNFSWNLNHHPHFAWLPGGGFGWVALTLKFLIILSHYPKLFWLSLRNSHLHVQPGHHLEIDIRAWIRRGIQLIFNPKKLKNILIAGTKPFLAPWWDMNIIFMDMSVGLKKPYVRDMEKIWHTD